MSGACHNIAAPAQQSLSSAAAAAAAAPAAVEMRVVHVSNSVVYSNRIRVLGFDLQRRLKIAMQWRF